MLVTLKPLQVIMNKSGAYLYFDFEHNAMLVGFQNTNTQAKHSLSGLNISSEKRNAYVPKHDLRCSAALPQVAILCSLTLHGTLYPFLIINRS